MCTTTTNHDILWENLLKWLQGLGMKMDDLLVERKHRQGGAGSGLFLRKACPPSTRILRVPSAAIYNIRTLSPKYPSHRLNATQLIAMHLSLHRQLPDSPYTAILPREFESHPLTFLVERHMGTLGHPGQTIVANLTPSTLRDLEALQRRFFQDWEVVKTYLANDLASQRSLDLQRSACLLDFLWGWLNVNTRCIYQQLSKSSSDTNNVALCPVLDFANHSRSVHMTIPGPAIRKHASIFADDLALISPEAQIPVGQELFLVYGHHSNRFLFSEYGFIDGDSPDREVDVFDLVQTLFQGQGPRFKNILEQEGYWGDWTLHASNRNSGHPSFRLITALRLYALFHSSPSSLDAEPIELEPWQDTLLGRRDKISDENEMVWIAVLAQLCADVEKRAKAGLDRLRSEFPPSSAPWFAWMLDQVRQLWDEELFVAKALKISIENGETF